MKSLRTRICSIVAMGLLAFAGVTYFVGCETVKDVADDVNFAVGGNPTSQPAATTQPGAAGELLNGSHEAAKVASGLSPAVASFLGTIGLLAGAVSTIAGYSSGKKTGTTQGVATATAQSNNIVAEIIDDVKEFKNPAVPWTAATSKLLGDLGFTAQA